jgi:hypothetical protein
VNLGIRGPALSCSAGGETTAIELPLSHASISRQDATVSVSVSEAVHPDCAHNGQVISFSCDSASEAESWQVEIEQAMERANSRHWGVSRGFICEERDRWAAVGWQNEGLTVAEYFSAIGLREVFEETWRWCPGVLAGLEAKANRSAADEKTIEYLKSKIDKTELYEDMELTDYMNVLKAQDLGGTGRGGSARTTRPDGKLVSYAAHVAAQSDNTGRRKVGKATVFVSHVWKMTTKEFFEVCCAELEDDDYAWIDLYLHNQFEGSLAATTAENTGYWINKFEQLVGGIGRVVAIVTNWEDPDLLKRIWCLFELNAAIEQLDLAVHPERLKFVASAAQKQDLSMNLNEKFQQLGAVISSINVSKGEATVPEDRTIFLSTLEGQVEHVNQKLRTQMQRWLCDAADAVIDRTDPWREPLSFPAMELEREAIGDYWYRPSSGSCSFPMIDTFFQKHSEDLSYRMIILSRDRVGARLTWMLERHPRLPAALQMFGWGSLPILPYVPCIMLVCTQDASLPTLPYGITGLGRNPWSWGDVAVACTLLFLMIVLVVTIGGDLVKHQIWRQLRQPPPFGIWCTRHYKSFILIYSWLGLGGLLVWFGKYLTFGGKYFVQLHDFYDFNWPLFWLVSVAYWVPVGPALVIQQSIELAVNRASLRVKVGWLRLELGESELAVEIFEEAHHELLRVVGTRWEHSWVVAAGLVRALCEAGRVDEAAAVCAQVEKAGTVKGLERCCCDSIFRFMDGLGMGMGWWLMLRAGVAAAARAPDSEVLDLLLQAVASGAFVPAGSRPRKGLYGFLTSWEGATEGWLPEWNEFLDRMAAIQNPDDTVSSEMLETRRQWQSYRDQMIQALEKPPGCLSLLSLSGERSNNSAAALQSRNLPKRQPDESYMAARRRLLASFFEHPAWAYDHVTGAGAGVVSISDLSSELQFWTSQAHDPALFEASSTRVSEAVALRATAEGVLYRTDPRRPKLDAAAMAREQQEIGEWNAKLSGLLERLPHLGRLLFVGGLALVAGCFWALGMWWVAPSPASAHAGWGWLALALAIGGTIVFATGESLHDHQVERQLRLPPVCRLTEDRLFLPVLALCAVVWYAVGWRLALMAFCGGGTVAGGTLEIAEGEQKVTIARVVLQAKVGLLVLRLGDVESAVAILNEAEAALLLAVGHDEGLRMLSADDDDDNDDDDGLGGQCGLAFRNLRQAMDESGVVRERTAIDGALTQRTSIADNNAGMSDDEALQAAMLVSTEQPAEPTVTIPRTQSAAERQLQQALSESASAVTLQPAAPAVPMGQPAMATATAVPMGQPGMATATAMPMPRTQSAAERQLQQALKESASSVTLQQQSFGAAFATEPEPEPESFLQDQAVGDLEAGRLTRNASGLVSEIPLSQPARETTSSESADGVRFGTAEWNQIFAASASASASASPALAPAPALAPTPAPAQRTFIADNNAGMSDDEALQAAMRASTESTGSSATLTELESELRAFLTSAKLEKYHPALVAMGALELHDLAELSEEEYMAEGGVGMQKLEVRRLLRNLKARGIGA